MIMPIFVAAFILPLENGPLWSKETNVRSIASNRVENRMDG